MEGCGKCMKYLMIVFNFLFFLCGGALLGVGIWVRVDGESFMNIVASNPVIFNAVYLIIAAGAALVLISFLGFCGALKENKCLLGMFFGIVLIVFVVEVVGGVLAFVYYPQVREIALNSMADYDPNGTNATAILITQGWDTAQSLFPCCGFDNISNWVDRSNLYSAPTPQVPPSCCTRVVLSLDGQVVNQTNCQALTSDFNADTCEARVQNYFWVLGGIGLGVLAVELLAMIFSCCLYCSVDKGY